MKADLRARLIGKKLAVEEITNAVAKNVTHITKIDYEIWYNPDYENVYEEYLKITFVGGGWTVRCCTGNSITSCIRALGQIVDGGYYDDVEFYRGLIERCKLLEVEGD